MPLAHSIQPLDLKSGAQGILIDVPHTTAVAIEVYFRAGNDYVENVKHHQTAHIMEHMAFGVNQKFDSAEAFSQELSKNGASFNASTWARGMSYRIDAALMEWDRILDVLQIAIAMPKYTQSILDAEKGNVREELSGNTTKHSRVLWQMLYKQLGDPSLTDSEKIETINAVTLDDIKKHFMATHTKHNMRIIIAGDLHAHRKEIEKMIDAWPLAQGKLLPVKRRNLHAAQPVSLLREDMTSSQFIISLTLNRELSRSESNAMDALNYMLTGTFHSRIFGKARRQGICYHVGSSTDTDVNGTSTWEFYGQVSSDNAKALVALIVEQLHDVALHGVAQKELDEAKQYALGGHQLRSQTVRGLVNDYFDDYFDKGEINSVEDIPQLIKDTNIKEIQRLVNEFLAAHIWTLGTIGPMQKQETQALYDQFAELFQDEVK